MTIEKYKTENVLPDGTLKNKPGQLVTKGRIARSDPKKGGCGYGTCNCSPGHWISVTFPRTDDGIVEGIKIQFKDKAEMDAFINGADIVCE